MECQYFHTIGICLICEELRQMTWHHLAPKQLVNLGLSDRHDVVMICRPCHDMIHVNFTNQQLLETHWPDVVEKALEEIEIAPIMAAQKALRRSENERNELLNRTTPPHVRKQMKKVKKQRSKVSPKRDPLTAPVFAFWP